MMTKDTKPSFTELLHDYIEGEITKAEFENNISTQQLKYIKGKTLYLNNKQVKM